MTGRRRTTLPLGISHADAAALLGGCDPSTALGRRDYAIGRTLLRLGLRANEAAGLALDDTGWRGGHLTVARHGRRAAAAADAGNAIAAYLPARSPASRCRAVFLTARTPVGLVMTRTVSSAVRCACRRAGIPRSGRRLRHTTACEMVFAGIRSCRPPRCCGTGPCRPRLFAPGPTPVACGSSRFRGAARKRTGERAARARRGLPPAAAATRVQARARGASARPVALLIRGPAARETAQARVAHHCEDMARRGHRAGCRGALSQTRSGEQRRGGIG